MKRVFAILLLGVLLAGCGSGNRTASGETLIELKADGILVNGGKETEAVYTSRDIVYYEDRETYDSGNPYGEGEAWERHGAQEAEAHLVVNITRPGTYRITGSLPAGQIRVDLGEEAREDPNAVVDLILSDADITCTVAPAILFLNTYECDGDWSEEEATANVDTSAAGANLILEGANTVSGSHVARIYKDADGEKKLWKQDGAIYSYMSMNVDGTGSLHLTADSEGLGTELHLTVNGGSIRIESGNDGINTNEDGVSVTTVNGGELTIYAGLGEEGDGIDSNGYLVINGGTVYSFAKPISDAGLDSDLGSFIHGGTVIATGSAMDWAESESGQVTMNLQFADQQEAGTSIEVRDLQGNAVFSWTPEYEEGLARGYRGMILSTPALKQGETYHIFAGETQLQFTGSDVGMGRPGMGGQRPGGKPGEMPEGFDPGNAAPPEGSFGGGWGMEGQPPEPQEGMTPPDMPEGGMPEDRQVRSEKGNTEFHMADMVNAFSGLGPITAE